MFEALIMLASPFIVKGVTGWAKNLGAIPYADYRVAIVRAIVAVLAVVTAVLAQWIGEGTLEPGLIETAVYAVAAAAVSTWLYVKEKGSL